MQPAPAKQPFKFIKNVKPGASPRPSRRQGIEYLKSHTCASSCPSLNSRGQWSLTIRFRGKRDHPTYSYLEQSFEYQSTRIESVLQRRTTSIYIHLRLLKTWRNPAIGSHYVQLRARSQVYSCISTIRIAWKPLTTQLSNWQWGWNPSTRRPREESADRYGEWPELELWAERWYLSGADCTERIIQLRLYLLA